MLGNLIGTRFRERGKYDSQNFKGYNFNPSKGTFLNGVELAMLMRQNRFIGATCARGKKKVIYVTVTVHISRMCGATPVGWKLI
jgi:hypothetical protein